MVHRSGRKRRHGRVHGYRVIAHDRRGHGRSAQPSEGNDMDHYADDLADLVQHLDLHDAVHIGHSAGGGEVARYVGRHGESRVAKVVLVSAVTPSVLQTDANPAGTPQAAFEGLTRRFGSSLRLTGREIARTSAAAVLSFRSAAARVPWVPGPRGGDSLPVVVTSGPASADDACNVQARDSQRTPGLGDSSRRNRPRARRPLAMTLRNPSGNAPASQDAARARGYRG